MRAFTQWAVRNVRPLVWGAWTIILLMTLSPLLGPPPTSGATRVSEYVVIAGFGFFILSMSTVGAVVASKRPENPLPWIMIFGSFWYALLVFTEMYRAVSTERGELPAADVLSFFTSVSWLVGLGVAGSYLLLLFPNGRLKSPRWKIVAWASGLSIALFVIGTGITPGNLEDVPGNVENPFGIAGAKTIGTILAESGLAMFFICIFASIASILMRYRTSSGETRQQLKWMVYAAFLILVTAITRLPIESQSAESETAVNIGNALFVVAVGLIPIAAGIAILKYRLYDIDVVINKTIVFGGLAAFITGIYVAIVVGIGTALGSSGKPNLALSIAATAVVAIAFTPVKERVQRFANRLVYGTRQSPYEVLADVARAVASTGEPTQALEAIARGAVLGTGSSAARVSLTHEGAHIAEQAWPHDAENQGDSLVLPVTHRGEVVGELALGKKPGEAVTTADRKLVEDLVTNAGLALYNARLNIELAQRLDDIRNQTEDLRSSRERIVSAQDDSRRRLERDISTGPRKRLDNMTSRLAEAKATLAMDSNAAASVLEDIGAEANATLDQLRELARGVYPPLLADKGLIPALEAQLRKKELDLMIDADGLAEARFPEAVETCVYFCAVELFSHMEPGSRMTVQLEGDSLVFRFEPVSDSERLRTLQDRVEALGGSLMSVAGGLVGRVPAHIKATVAS